MIEFLRRFSLSVFVTKNGVAYSGGDNYIQRGVFITAEAYLNI